MRDKTKQQRKQKHSILSRYMRDFVSSRMKEVSRWKIKFYLKAFGVKRCEATNLGAAQQPPTLLYRSQSIWHLPCDLKTKRKQKKKELGFRRRWVIWDRLWRSCWKMPMVSREMRWSRTLNAALACSSSNRCCRRVTPASRPPPHRRLFFLEGQCNNVDEWAL